VSRTETFAVTSEPTLQVSFGSGLLRIQEGEAGAVRIDLDGRGAQLATATQSGGRITVDARREELDVVATVPAGCRLDVRVASADVAVNPTVGQLRVQTASGDIRAADVAGDATVTTASGEVEVGDVAGTVRVRTASGDVRTGTVAKSAKFATASGDVTVAAVCGDLSLQTVSGDALVNRAGGRDISIKSVSGSVRLGLPPGRRIMLDASTLSGDIRNDFTVGDGNHADVKLRVRTVSGDITLHGA
jgi:DUF4097 and DUF4098 domain-containing protein YvlB